MLKYNMQFELQWGCSASREVGVLKRQLKRKQRLGDSKLFNAMNLTLQVWNFGINITGRWMAASVQCGWSKPFDMKEEGEEWQKVEAFKPLLQIPSESSKPWLEVL